VSRGCACRPKCSSCGFVHLVSLDVALKEERERSERERERGKDGTHAATGSLVTLTLRTATTPSVAMPWLISSIETLAK